LSRHKNNDGRPQRGAEDGKSYGKLAWSDLGGEYLHFTLYKENKDTMEVIGFLSSKMKLHTRNFQFSGTKDRRGVTVQRISGFRVQAARLAGLASSLRQSYLGGFKYEKQPLALGQLQGNEFHIVLRDCHFPNEQGLDLQERQRLGSTIVDKAVHAMATNGFINYYGLQRFGAFATSTDQIGVKLLHEDLKGAVALILECSPEVLAVARGEKTSYSIPNDDRKRAEALHVWETTRDAKRAMELMPRKYSAETAIIRHLGQRKQGKALQENDWQGALAGIQRNMRLMYVHAYQSLVWNTVAGHRWETHGGKVVEGDLVIVEQPDQQFATDVDEAGELIVQPAGADRATVEEDFVRARPMTQAEVESNKFSIWDVVLPLPGFDVEYPANDIGKFYKDFMGSEKGGKLDPHNMRRKWKDISLSGGYRKLLARPGKMECEVKSYVSDTEQLVKTDLDRLCDSGAVEPKDPDSAKTTDNDSMTHDKLAVILKMQLGSSQYATMALRELLKAGGLKTFKADFSKDVPREGGNLKKG
jgi:tRNA pseudouridine13 synthase